MDGIEVGALTAAQLKTVQDDLGITNKQDALTFDDAPAADSSNPVTSAGIKAALDAKQDTLTFDTTPTADSANPCTSGGIKSAIDLKQNGSIGAFATYFADYADYTTANDLINHLNNYTESWTQTNNSIASTLYTNGVIPIAKAGVLHVVNTAKGGRCLVELYADDGIHYHYETSNSSSTVGTWQTDINSDNLTSILSSFYYKAGDSIVVQLATAGYVTDTAKQFRFTLPVNKKITADGATFTLTGLTLRQGGNYIGGTSATASAYDSSLISSVDAVIKDNCIDMNIKYKATASSAVNNDVFGIYVAGTLKFTDGTSTASETEE